jgi:hypothetical protein
MWTLLLSGANATATRNLNARQNRVAAKWAQKTTIRRYVRRRVDQ